MNGRRYPLRKMLLFSTITVVIFSLVYSFLFIGYYSGQEIQRQVQTAGSIIQLYADDTVSIEYGRKNWVYVADTLRRLKENLHAEELRIRDNNGNITISTDSSKLAFPKSAHDFVTSVSIREHSSQEKIGTLEIVIDRVALTISAMKKALVQGLLLFFLILLVAAVLLISFRRDLIQPIRELLDPDKKHAPQYWPDEIRDLHGRLQKALKDQELAIIGQFCSGILHDIRTPLQSVFTAMGLVEKCKTGDPKRAARLENLQTMCSVNLPIVKEIIETTLDSSRNIKISKANGDLLDTIRLALSQNQSLLNLRQVSVDLDTSNSVVVPHDKVQIARVIANLVKNAVEAVPPQSEGPKIRISIDNIGQSATTVSIEDNGTGLKTISDDIFHTFRSSKIRGSGLGLNISRKIIESHRGQIRASNRSSLGGARFEFTIPSTSEEVAQ